MTDPVGDLASRLAAARAAGRKLLVPFLTAGFPDPATCAQALVLVANAGADAIELGVPFSDPVADGPTIARASQHALARGASLAGAIALGAAYTAPPPLVLFTYVNPLIAMGAARAARACREARFGGVLVADLPFDEDPTISAALTAEGLPLIRLAAPTTSPARLRALGAGAQGFIYLIARTGVTGTGRGSDSRLAEQVAILRAVTALPVVVGFGIADDDQARRTAAVADGIVIGSALVERLGREGPVAAAEWVGSIRRALDRG